jgi:hypothetical protein
VIAIDENFQVTHTDNKVRARETAQQLVQACKAQLLASGLVVPDAKIASFSSCMESQVNTTLEQKQEERQFQSQLRETMAHELVNYACNDFEFNTTMEVLNRTWHYDEMEGVVRNYVMQVVHERPSSMIFYISNFASTRECQASVNSIDATTTSNTKANANTKENANTKANSTVPWSALDAHGTDGFILHKFSNKLYELARTALQWPSLQVSRDKQVQGSSLFQVHQDDNDSKAAFAECEATSGSDGENEQGVCQRLTSTSSPLRTKPFHVDDPKQLGTAFLFCNVPQQGGGAVHFPSAGIHINPEPGMLIFATHRQGEHELDGFVQEYHMCPHHNVLTHSFVQP